MADPRPKLIQTLALVFVCTLLLIPSEIHGTLAEVGAHDIQGPVSIDARHAGQRAHFEHSLVEMHGPCAACLLTRKPDRLLILPQLLEDRTTDSTSLPVSDPLLPASIPDRLTAGRAPPLLWSR